MTENEVGKIIVDAAIAVHRELGPGLLETVYEVNLAYELRQRGLSVEHQMPMSVHYKGMVFDVAFRAGLIVEKIKIVELKSVEQVSQAHKKEVQTYLRLTGCKLGFLLDFGEALMKRGITRAVNGLPDA
jgi:GxxExxY protein